MKKFEWPWISKRKAKIASDNRAAELQHRERRERDRLEEEWQRQWQPLLQKAMSLKATRNQTSGDFILHVGIARDMLEMAAMHNDPKVWDYISDRLAYEFKRQISTLNFSGLHRMAVEAEHRYPPPRAYASGSVRW